MHIIWPKCVRNDFIKVRTLKQMHRNDITIVCRKIWQFKQNSVWVREGVGVNAILKKVGLYLQNDSDLISNSPYIIKLASKLKLWYSTFI